jgi:superfamily II DNA or RNA helicase
MNTERIIVTNTAIIVQDYELHSCEELERVFSKWDGVTHKLSYMCFHYDEENKRLYLPAGMDLWFVRKCLNERYYTRIEHDPFEYLGNVKMKFPPRDNDQVEALKFMCGIEEYQDNIHKPQLLLSLATGIGKTYCSIATMCFFGIKSIVITNSNSLLSQWEGEILKYTNISEKEIVRISGSDYCNMILNGSSNKANNGKVYLCSHGTLRSFGERYGWDKVHELFIKLKIGLKFYDECHMTYENMMLIDYFSNTYKTYYVSATPGRSDYRENRIFQISLKNVPMIDLFDENKNPHTNYVAIKWNSHPSAMQISYCKHRIYKFDRNKYVDYVTRKPEFYDMLRVIMDMVKSATKNGGVVLMYIGTNEGILRVYKWIADNYREYIGDIGVFTSLVDKETKLKEKKKKILLSTTKSAGLGEHINNLKMTVVLAEIFKSDILARQTLGRTRDDNTLYVELVDLGFIYTKKFYYAKQATFNKYAKDVSDITIDSYELNRRAEIIKEERDIGWKYPAVSIEDKRFNLDDYDVFKEEESEGPKCPVKFFPKEVKPKLFDE